jgi:hypothetical protein
MTTRTYRYFICPNGHKGNEIKDDYDPDASSSWAGLMITGMSACGKDGLGHDVYVCGRCRHPMTLTDKP